MFQHVFEFAPPLDGIEGAFNTIRMGLAWSKRVKAGDRVFLMDNKAKAVVGEAMVESVVTGQLADMLAQHARFNHKELDSPDPENAPARRFESLSKLYGPRVVSDNKKSTVIYLRRIKCP